MLDRSLFYPNSENRPKRCVGSNLYVAEVGGHVLLVDWMGVPVAAERLSLLRDALAETAPAYEALGREGVERLAIGAAVDWERDDEAYTAYLRAARSAPADRHGFVYLAASDTGHHKIGRSVDPEGRVEHFATKMPVRVDLVHTVECDDYVDAEALLHKRFGPKRGTGEWFDLDADDLAWLLSLAAFEGGRFRTASGEWISWSL